MVAVGFIDDSSSAYGNARHHRAADLTGNGGVDGADQLALLGSWNGYGVGDLNRDGIVDGADMLILQSNWGGALVAGELSQTDNIIGYAGYIFNGELVSAGSTGLYTVRHRHYAPDLGRLLSRDPIGYVDGMSLYEYVAAAPIDHLDSDGLQRVPRPRPKPRRRSTGDENKQPHPADFIPRDSRPGTSSPSSPARQTRGTWRNPTYVNCANNAGSGEDCNACCIRRAQIPQLRSCLRDLNRRLESCKRKWFPGAYDRCVRSANQDWVRCRMDTREGPRSWFQRCWRECYDKFKCREDPVPMRCI